MVEETFSNKTDTRKAMRRSSLMQLLIGIAIIIVLNIIGSLAFYRLDLTSEKRYTLSPATREMLRKLDDVVYFKVYLEGDFPAGFQRLRNETREMLNQLRAYNNNIQYEFINPSAGSDKKANENLYKQLVESGLNPTDLQVKTKEGFSRKLIFPGAIASYHGKEIAVDLLMTDVGRPSDEVLNNSVEALEYNLMNSIRKLMATAKPKIAFIEGQGELPPLYTAGIESALSEFYEIDHLRINGRIGALTDHRVNSADSNRFELKNKYAAIIIAKPDSAFGKDEHDKFIIDQFIMNGGKALWLIDPVKVSMDSLQRSSQTVALTNELNIDDMLFNYGVRLNSNLVVDMNALPIPVVIDQRGNQKLVPWLFFPVLIPASQHPIVRNLNAIKTEFISSLDTVEAPGIRKTILLTTSRYSKVLNTPVMVSLRYLNQQPDVAAFNQPNQPVATLLEGEFTSLFFNRIPPEVAAMPALGFREKSSPTQMIVVADGDVIKNQVQPGAAGPTPLTLGYDRYTGQQFGNKDFILNALNYLCDDSNLLTLRSRQVTLRELDQAEVDAGRLKWKLINTVVPVLLVVAFALGQAYLRKRKYGKHTQ